MMIKEPTNEKGMWDPPMWNYSRHGFNNSNLADFPPPLGDFTKLLLSSLWSEQVQRIFSPGPSNQSVLLGDKSGVQMANHAIENTTPPLPTIHLLEFQQWNSRKVLPEHRRAVAGNVGIQAGVQTRVSLGWNIGARLQHHWDRSIGFVSGPPHLYVSQSSDSMRH